jgi:HEAT repeat protein
VFDEVFKLVNDQDPLVRIEVARTFSERCTSQTATFARSYISDRNRKVQSATLEAVCGWSVEESGPLLLAAAKSPFQEVRCYAVEMLAQRGVAYSGFDPEDKPEKQAAQHQELVETFRETVGVDPMLESNNKERNPSPIQQVSAIAPEDAKLSEVRKCLDDWSDRTMPSEQRQLIHRRLTVHGHRLMPMIDHLFTVEKQNIPESLDRVFAEVEPIFQEIEKLKSDDLSTVRRAATELSRLGAVGSPPKLAAKRIVDLAAKQDDPLVLTSLLTALENADPDLVCQLARPLLQSDSARVRRLACEMLKQFGTSEDVELLHDSLRDSSREVVCGALSAIDTLLEEEGADASSVLQTLKVMLTQGDAGMQVDVASTLHRQGHSEGTDALRRLAASSDHNARIYVARTIPGLGDPVFVPILIRFLDDTNGTVRSEALKGLPKLTGQDIGGGSTQQQIERWKGWAKK